MYILPLTMYIQENSDLNREEATALAKDILEETAEVYIGGSPINYIKTLVWSGIETRIREKNKGIVKYDIRCEKCEKLLFRSNSSLSGIIKIEIKCPRCKTINKI